jgi:tetratricopeptide (TPR) repeat protein
VGQSGGSHEIQATGDAMNVAARLEGIAEPGAVVISEATLRLVPGLFVTKDLGRPSLKGVSSPPRAHQVLQVAGTRDPSGLADHLTPFVGRERELALLLEHWHSTERGEGRVVLFSGEPGIGKSRLLLELRERTAKSDERNWLTFRCSAHHQNSALHPVLEALEQIIGIDRSESGEAQAAKLVGYVEGLGLSNQQAVPLLARLLSLPAAESDSAQPNTQLERRRTLRLLTDLVLLQASRSPMVLVVEDVHWADPSTFELLALLVREVANDSLLVLLSFRPQLNFPWQPPPHQSSIELPRLSEPETERLIAAWTISRDLPMAVREAVVARTDGVPLFVEELTRTVLESDLVERLGEGELAPEAEHLIPSTLRDSLAARIDALGPAREVVQLAAVLGRRFRYELLAATSSLSDDELGDRLSLLVDANLLIRSGARPNVAYIFRHALIQDTAYESLLKSRRREHHARIAQVLESQFPDLVEGEPETLARHCEEAGLLERAQALYQRAGGRAAHRWEYVEASHSYHKALALLRGKPRSIERDEQELALLQEMALPISATRGYTAPELRDIYERERELLTSLGDRVDEFPVLQNIWGFHCVHGDRAETLAAADNMLQLCERSDRPGVRAAASWMVGATAFYTGDHVRAEPFLNAAVEHYRADANRDSTRSPLFLAALTHGWSRVLAGRSGLGMSLLQESVELSERTGDPFALTQASSHLAMAAYALGRDAGEIHRIADRTAKLSQEQHLPQTLASAQMHLGWCAALQGDPAGIGSIRESIELTRMLGTLNPVPNMLTVLADALIELGREDEALEVIDECMSVYETNICRLHEPFTLLLKARVLRRRGDRSRADATLRTSLRIASGHGAKIFELRAATALADLLYAGGATDEGIALLTEVLDALPEGRSERYAREAMQMLDDLSRAVRSEPEAE